MAVTLSEKDTMLLLLAARESAVIYGPPRVRVEVATAIQEAFDRAASQLPDEPWDL